MNKLSDLSGFTRVLTNGSTSTDNEFATGAKTRFFVQEKKIMPDNKSIKSKTETEEEKIERECALRNEKRKKFEEKYPEFGFYVEDITIAYLEHAKRSLDEYVDLFKAFEHVRKCAICWQKIEMARAEISSYSPQPDIKKYILFEGAPE